MNKEERLFLFFEPFQLFLYGEFFRDPHLHVKLFLLNVHVDIFKHVRIGNVNRLGYRAVSSKPL